MSATAAALSSVRWKSDRTARARSTKSWIASNWLSSSADVRRLARRGSDRGGTETTLLAADAERLPARHEQLEARAVGEQLDEGRRGDGDLLEVVEDEQDLLPAEPAPERVERRALRPSAEADRARDQARARRPLSVAVTRSTK